MTDPVAWETHRTWTAYDGYNFDVKRDLVTLPNGDDMEFEYVRESDAVVILPFTIDGDVVVVSEWRQAVRRYVEHGLPGGAIDGDETAAEAAQRELTEETGYEAAELSPLFVSEPHPGVTGGTQNFFVATGCERVSDPSSPDEAEQTTVTTESLSGLLDGIASGQVRDARTIQPVLYYEHVREDADQDRS